MVFASFFLVVFLYNFTAFCSISFHLSYFMLWIVFYCELYGLMSIQAKRDQKQEKQAKTTF